MQDRARVDVAAEVVVRLPDEEPVRDVEERGLDATGAPSITSAGAATAANAAAVTSRTTNDGWEQAAEAPGVEAREPDAALAVDVAQEQLGDEVAGEDEEDVDADEAAVEAGEPGVERDDQVHRDRAQPVELGPVVRRRVRPVSVSLTSRRITCHHGRSRYDPPLPAAAVLRLR